jgi:hypothetical protein
MKWSKSRVVVVVGACLSNVWCGSPGMLRPARGSPTPTDRMFAPFRRLPPPACPVVTNDQSGLDGGAVICNPGRATWEGPRVVEKSSAAGVEHSGSAAPKHDEDCRQRRPSPLQVGVVFAGSRAGPGRTPQPLWWSIREAPDDEA